MVKILHTSDWHLGRTLYGKTRYEEFEAFLNWLSDVIQQNEVDVLLVSGDIFDTTTPSNRAQELYYAFLCRMVKSACRHVVITAGNHDSPSFLSAPKAILKSLNVHVIGRMADSLDEEVLLFYDESQKPELIVCAVPYLRDRDIRTVEAGESVSDKERKLLEGIRRHYEDVFTLAEEKKMAAGSDIPIVAMGHLFLTGGKTTEDDGVRELYVGSLARVSTGIFPSGFDYVALGHLHVPQNVKGNAHFRYSGSPLPMGFGEAAQQKSVSIVEFDDKKRLSILEVKVPVFQKLVQIKGALSEIQTQLKTFSEMKEPIWVEVVHEGNDTAGNLRELLEKETEGTSIEILRIMSYRSSAGMLQMEEESLNDLDDLEVFIRRLETESFSEMEQAELIETYKEAVHEMQTKDPRKE